MAFTKVLGPGIHTLSNITSHNIHSSGIITATGFDGPFTNLNVTGVTTFSGDVSIGGTLTYEDVKNIDSIGIVTAREGIDLPTDKKILLGDNDKFTIYKSSSPAHAIIENAYSAGSYLRIGSANGVIIGSPISHNQSMIRGYVNGRAELYYAGSEKIRTTDKGIQVGTGVTIETNGNSNFVGVSSLGTGATGAVYLYNPDADALSGTTNDIYGWKAKTYTQGLQVNSTLYLSRSGSNGLGLAYNNATGSYITAESGFLRVGVPYGGYFNIYSNDVYIKDRLQTKNYAHFQKVSGTEYKVNLYGGNNVVKLTTEESGVNIVGTTTTTQLAVTGVSTFSSDISIISTGDANLNLVADTGNNNEASVPTINFTQDGGTNVFKVGVEGNAGDTFTGSTGNTPYLITTTGHGGMSLDFGTNNALRMKLTNTALQPAASNTYDLGTNTLKWRDIYVDNFKTTTTGFEAVGTQFKFSDTGDCNVIINADTDNYDENHHPSLSFKQDGSTHVLDIGVNGSTVDYTGATHNFAYVRTGGHLNIGLEIATGNTTSVKRLTIDHNGHITPGADSTYNIGSSALRFANLYADTLYGAVQNTTFTSAVTVDINGNNSGTTTLLTLDNYVGADITTQYSFIDFTFRDGNSNNTPQVKIGAQVMDDSSTGQQGEGAGDFVVQCAVDNASNTMTEMFRCSHDTKITSVHHHPQSDSNFDLGTNTVRWRNVYADTLYGDGSNLTGISAGTSLSGSTNNTVCTVTGANAIQGESNLTFNGSRLDVLGNTDGNVQASFTSASDPNFKIQFRNESSSNNVGESQGKFGLFYDSNSADICGMQFLRGASTGAGTLIFTNGGTETFRIESGGAVKMSTNNARIRMGSGHVFELYHNGTYSYISDNRSGGSDELRIAGRAVRILNQDSSSTTGYFSYTAAKLYYTNYEKLSTVDYGVNFAGTGAIKVPVGTTAQRPTGSQGMLRINTTSKNLELYGNTGWVNVVSTEELGTSTNPAKSGKVLYNLGKSSGNYYIKPDGYTGAAIECYVDMTTHGGGWVLVASFTPHSGFEMSSNTGGLNTSSVKSYYTTKPPNGNTRLLPKDFINYLAHQNTTNGTDSDYSIMGVHGRSGTGYVHWEVKANTSNRSPSFDFYRAMYKSNNANNNMDFKIRQETSTNSTTDYVGKSISGSYSNYNGGRAGTQDGNGSYHYLIDDHYGGYEWAFRENVDDIPSNGFNLSVMFVR